MACELGELKIRVNTLSPGYIYTALSAEFLDKHPNLVTQLGSENPLGRLGKPHELRGAVTWLASDASTFCTGSEYALSLFRQLIPYSSLFLSQYSRHRWPPLMVDVSQLLYRTHE